MEEELKELLESIPDAYDDFSEGICECCKTDEERQKIIDYIRGDSGVTTSDVLDYYYDEVRQKRE